MNIYNFDKKNENIVTKEKDRKNIIFINNNIQNFIDKKKILKLYNNFSQNYDKKYEMIENIKIITFVIFNNNENLDLLFINLLNINKFHYKNIEVLIINYGEDNISYNSIENISFNFNIKITFNKLFNDDIIKSFGDILIILKSNTIFINNILHNIIENFEYNHFYNYYSIDLKNIKDNDKIIENNNIIDNYICYNNYNKYEINKENYNCFVISKNYFKILNGFNYDYNLYFDFIFYDFYNKAKNIIKMNMINIENSIINMFIVNNYNNIDYTNQDDNDNIKTLSIKYLYNINKKLYDLFFNLDIKKTKQFDLIIKKSKYFKKIITDNLNIKNKKYIKFINNINKNDKIINNSGNINIIFFNIQNTTSSFNFYMNNMKKYYNIIKTKYNVSYRDIKLNFSDNFNKNNIIEYLYFNNNDIFMIDDMILTVLVTSHLNIISIRNDLEHFIKNAKYIVCFTEIFLSDNLQFTGCSLNNKNFVKLIFENSITNLILNTLNLYYLYSNNIYNHIYFPAYGYSEINNICYNKINNNKNYEIDIIFYGNYLDKKGSIVSKNRYETINYLKDFAFKNNIIFKTYTNLYEEKDIILNKTKIVIHIGMYKHYHVLSWAKIVELMAKKIFFIVEDNEEIYFKNIQHIIPHYERNNINDLYDKINYYLKNEDHRNHYIELCYNYIKENYNMDNFILKLLNNI